MKLRTTRGSWRSQLGSGWPESTAASSVAAAGVRSCTGTVLQGVRGGCWSVLRAPSEMWSTMVSLVGRYGDRGHDGDIAGGVKLSAAVGLGPRGWERAGKKGETVA